jgi:hypothetical protein
LALFLLVFRTSLSCFRVLLQFMTNCLRHSRARRSATRPRRLKGDSEETSGRCLGPMLPVNSSQRHKPPHDSISHTKTDDHRFFARPPQSRPQPCRRSPRCLASCGPTVRMSLNAGHRSIAASCSIRLAKHAAAPLQVSTDA